MSNYLLAGMLIFGLAFSARALAETNADELYRQGRFKEAEKAYADSDMDHPKDVKYRYNRGCAAYENSDFQGAMAAFSSVLRRSKDKSVRFRTSYNLGNTAFKLGDYDSAVSYYRQAVIADPTNEDAPYNLELALRALEKQKKQKSEEEQKKQNQKEQDRSKDKGEQSKADKKKENSDKQPQEKSGDHQNTPQGKKDKADQTPQDKEAKGSEKKEKSPSEGLKNQEKPPEDLSGELRARQAMPEKEAGEKSPDTSMSMIDKKKAEALLNNIKEDRSRFLRLQVPKDKRDGVMSGKDW